MRSIYKTILSRFISASLLPVFIIEVSLLVALFWMNATQSEQTKESLREISAEIFSQIAQGTGREIQQQFLQAKHEIAQLSYLANQMFSNPKNFSHDKVKLRYDRGFFRDGKGKELSSVYTTNLKKLLAKDKKNLELLTLLDGHVKQMVSSNKDLLQGAWINISKYYNLFYPKIDVPNELSPTLDVTKQHFYYEADAEHNPDKKIKFISMYQKSWAVKFGQMGAYLSPIYANDTFVGVIGVNVTVNKTVQTLMDLKLPFNAFALLLDNNKHILASSDEKRSFKEMGKHSFYANYLRAKNNQSFEALSKIDPQKLLSSQKMIFPYKIAGTEYTIMFCANNNDIYGPVDLRYAELRKVAFLILALIAFFYSLYFIYIFRHVKKLALKISLPIKGMVAMSSKLGSDEVLEFPQTEIKELAVLNQNFLKTHDTLIQLVNYDEATHLYNHQKLRRDIMRDKTQRLIFFKLENFDQYNNLFGPVVGTKVLVELVGHLESCPHAQGKLYRENKDTIALLVEDIDGDVAIDNLKGMLTRIGNEKLVFEGVDINFSLKAGVTKGEINDGIDLIAQAHIAISECIIRNVSSYVVYEDIYKITTKYQENLLWSKHVKDAFIYKRFIPYYQPIYCYETQKIEKFEALVRMDLDGEIISPFKFLDAASTIGRLHEITLLMVDNVFRMAAKYPTIEFSVNTSFEDFEEGKLVDYVKVKLNEYRIDSSKIIFELLETQTFSDGNKVVHLIESLQALGFKVAIDDFGTGHSNFSHLAMLNVDFIKIDGMFIKDLEDNAMSEKMVRSMVSFAKEIGAKTIGEFVHNEAVFRIVEGLGIDYAQGYFKSPPLAENDVKKLLSS